jgi:hypothetical protein
VLKTSKELIPELYHRLLDIASGSRGAFLLIPQKSVQKKQAFEMRYLKQEEPGAVQGGLGCHPI